MELKERAKLIQISVEIWLLDLADLKALLAGMLDLITLPRQTSQGRQAVQVRRHEVHLHPVLLREVQVPRHQADQALVVHRARALHQKVLLRLAPHPGVLLHPRHVHHLVRRQGVHRLALLQRVRLQVHHRGALHQALHPGALRAVRRHEVYPQALRQKVPHRVLQVNHRAAAHHLKVHHLVRRVVQAVAPRLVRRGHLRRVVRRRVLQAQVLRVLHHQAVVDQAVRVRIHHRQVRQTVRRPRVRRQSRLPQVVILDGLTATNK